MLIFCWKTQLGRASCTFTAVRIDKSRPQIQTPPSGHTALAGMAVAPEAPFLSCSHGARAFHRTCPGWLIQYFPNVDLDMGLLGKFSCHWNKMVRK